MFPIVYGSIGLARGTTSLVSPLDIMTYPLWRMIRYPHFCKTRMASWWRTPGSFGILNEDFGFADFEELCFIRFRCKPFLNRLANILQRLFAAASLRVTAF